MKNPKNSDHSTPIIHEYITAADEDITANNGLMPSAEGRVLGGHHVSATDEFVSWFDRWIAPQPKND